METGLCRFAHTLSGADDAHFHLPPEPPRKGQDLPDAFQDFLLVAARAFLQLQDPPENRQGLLRGASPRRRGLARAARGAPWRLGRAIRRGRSGRLLGPVLPNTRHRRRSRRGRGDVRLTLVGFGDRATR